MPLELMSKHEQKGMADEMLREHGLAAAGWQFRFGRPPHGWLGCCDYARKSIVIDGLALPGRGDLLRDVILHEIAHALLPPECGHGREWQAMAISLNCNPTPYTSVAGVSVAPSTRFCFRSAENFVRRAVCKHLDAQPYWDRYNGAIWFLLGDGEAIHLWENPAARPRWIVLRPERRRGVRFGKKEAIVEAAMALCLYRGEQRSGQDDESRGREARGRSRAAWRKSAGLKSSSSTKPAWPRASSGEMT